MSSLKCEQCGKEGAAMQCPTCKQLGLPPSYFCEQSCFKAAWPTHKAKHSAPLLKSMPDNARLLFDFTGSVRPGLISPPRAVPKDIPRPDYIGQKGGESRLEAAAYGTGKCTVWKGEELASIREVAHLSREILEIAMAAVRPGVTTDEIDRIVHEATIERKLYPSPLGYNEFPKSVCTSVNEIICHGIPDSRELLPTDLLNIDVSAFGTAHGMHADLNETVFVSREAVDDASLKLLRGGYAALMAGVSTVRPGALYKHIGDAISAKCDEYGFSVVRSITGHGLGKLFHCPPTVPHYANNKTPGTMKEGHLFTIEPMVCEGGHEDVQWPDQWTVATKDGGRCAMFEHMVLVNADGRELLTCGRGATADTFLPYFERQLLQWQPAQGTTAERDAD